MRLRPGMLLLTVVLFAAPAVPAAGAPPGTRAGTGRAGASPRRVEKRGARASRKSSRAARAGRGRAHTPPRQFAVGRARSRVRERILEEAARSLAGNPHARLVADQIAPAAKKLRATVLPSWNDELPTELHTGRLEDVAYYLFVLNSVNYRFWDRSPDGEMRRWKNGSASLAQLFVELYDKGRLPGFHIAAGDVERTIRKELGSMPDKQGRLAHLADVSRRREFERVFRTARRNGRWQLTADLAERLARVFPTYRDPYLKRAQLTLGMIGGHFASRGERVSFGLTAYADYRVPQVLRHLGVIELGPELAERIARGETLPRGGPEERAIRAATVLAVARLAEETGLSDPAIDAALFLVSREDAFRTAAEPHHLTPTRNY